MKTLEKICHDTLEQLSREVFEGDNINCNYCDWHEYDRRTEEYHCQKSDNGEICPEVVRCMENEISTHR